MLEECIMVCVYAPGTFNYDCIYDLIPQSVRFKVHRIPFIVSKPNYSHVILAFKRLMTVHVRDRIDTKIEDEEMDDSGEEDSIEDDNMEADYELDNEPYQNPQPVKQRKRSNSYQKKMTNRDWTSEPLTPLSASTCSPLSASTFSPLSATHSSASFGNITESVFDIAEGSSTCVRPPLPTLSLKKEIISPPNPIFQFMKKVQNYRITIICIISVALLLYIILTEDYKKERKTVGLEDED